MRLILIGKISLRSHRRKCRVTVHLAPLIVAFTAIMIFNVLDTLSIYGIKDDCDGSCCGR
ncbi:hypothetical protein KIN20_028140, partial [Parelaphostrongylus tenuis]